MNDWKEFFSNLGRWFIEFALVSICVMAVICFLTVCARWLGGA